MGICLVGLVGLGLYHWWKNRQVSPAWAAVPVTAVAVFEADNPLEQWQQWKENPTWQSFWSMPYVQTIQARMDSLQGLPEAKQVLSKKKILFSLHATTRHDFDYVFYIPLSERDQSQVSQLFQHFRHRTDFRVDTRTFGGQLITEITHRPSRQLVSFIVQDDMLIGSYTSFLVEDVIRKLGESSVNSDKQWVEWQAQRGASSSSPIRVFVNFNTLPRLAVVATGSTTEAGILANAGQFSALTLEQGKNSILLKGKTYLPSQPQEKNYLSVFDEQAPQPVGCLSLIPNQTAVFYHWSFSNPQAFFQHQQKYDLSHGAKLINQSFSWVGKEMALALVETTSEQPDRLLFVKTTKPQQSIKEIDAQVSGSSRSYTENYAGATIRQIDEAEFPAKLFGSVINGFPQCFYALIDSYVVFGNSVQSIKNILDKRASGDVWSQSKKKSELQKSAHFTIHVDVDHAWALLLRNAAPHWSQLLQQYSGVWKDFETLQLQIGNHRQGAYDTEVLAVYREKNANAPQQNQFLVNWRTNADTLLAQSPLLVRSHVDHSREVLIQDAAHRLYLVNQSGKILWRKWLESSIQSEVYQIDYLKNNKLQYLFASKSHLHIVDRNGNPVAPYPLRVSSQTALHTLSLIDYDGNREYRFLVSDLLGNLYMYDKTGNLLEGWNPLHTGYRLQCAPEHLRIHDKDYFVVMQANGKLTLLNRRGQPYAGFPVDLSARTESNFLIERGLTPETTYITVVTRDGEIIRVDLSGKTVERRQLYRTSGSNQFLLCAEPTGHDWVVARIDNRNISILNAKGSQIWETSRQSAQMPKLQYYNFGAGLRLIAITSADQTSVYELSGTLIGNEPLPSSHAIAAVYVDAYDKLLLYYTNKAQVGLVSVKVK